MNLKHNILVLVGKANKIWALNKTNKLVAINNFSYENFIPLVRIAFTIGIQQEHVCERERERESERTNTKVIELENNMHHPLRAKK
jgi:hypothetical protein